MPEQFLGVVIDPRSEIQKAQDWRHDEFAAATPAPVEWAEKNEFRHYPKRDQNGSSSCMAQSGAKMLGIENVVEENTFVELSARPVYRSRMNFPGGGMYQQDLFALLSKPTACLEKDMPSQQMSEDAMNTPLTRTAAMQTVAEYYRANGYVFLAPNNIDEIARVIDQGKAVHLLMYFAADEWWKPYPVLLHADLPNDANQQHHGITGVDRTLYDGKKALVIEDSAGLWTTIDSNGQRILTEDFLKARCYGAGYLIFKKNAEPSVLPKPSHHFTRALAFGLMHDSEVAALQKILQYEKYLPTELDGAPLPLGNMLQMTCGAVKKWGVAHGIMDFASEPDVRKVRFGPKSIALANALYP